MRLSEFIKVHQEDILKDWENFAATLLPAAGTLDRAELRDSAAEILNAIADDMESIQSRREQIDKTRAQRGEARFAVEATAQDHAADRLAQKFTLNQVIAEYRALRVSVLRRWSNQPENGGAEVVAELMRFDEAVDGSLASAVAWFDARLREHETQVREVERASERRYRALAELSPDAILVNQGGSFVYANEAAVSLLGCRSREQLIGKSPYQLIEESYHDTIRKRIDTAEAGEAVPLIEERWKKANGESVEVEVAAGPIPWEGETGVQVIVRDITERKGAEKALRQMDRAKDEFLAVLGHELRNPLAPLRTGLNVLERAPRDPELLDRVVPLMGRQLSHLVRLVDDLLDISRVTRGAIKLQRGTLDLNIPIQAAIEQARSLIESRGHRLLLELSRDRLPVYGDSERLTQVAANLLSNAAKYTNPGGTITVTTGRKRGQAFVRVRDTGLGIAPEDRTKVFELFGQIAAHQGREGDSGLGIGLALSRQLVQMHGGTIEAKSEGVGRGSEFLVQLALAPSEHQQSSDSSREEKRVDQARRILVVDDNVDAAEGLRMLLELRGHTVEAVYSGAAVLQAVERLKPEVVLLDLGLPDMSGIEVARKIRSSPAGAAIRLIAVTGWAQDEDRARTKQAGFDDHLTKPVDAAELAAALGERTS